VGLLNLWHCSSRISAANSVGDTVVSLSPEFQFWLVERDKFVLHIHFLIVGITFKLLADNLGLKDNEFT
jgi:hypothetical protein